MSGAPDATGTRLAEEIAAAASASGRTIAVAESLTAGNTAAALGAAPEASEWFRGGVVAYAPEVKFEVLGVRPGPVITAECAREMAYGVRARLRSDLAVAVTGAGGPGPEEDQPAGTVYLACVGPDGTLTEKHVVLDGPPERVVEVSVLLMLNLLYEALVEVSVVG